MGQRLELQDILEEIQGSTNVYFQPPTNFKMSYPCIVYNRDQSRIQHADNRPYNIVKRYSVTVIDANPDSLTPDKVEQLPLCEFRTRFAADNLYHTIFNLYF